jgi:quercetin dioxygenase-like cupin family protein
MGGRASHGAFADLPVAEPYEGLRRRTFDSAGSTVNEYSFEPGASFPIHRHPEEQVTLILEGSVELAVEGDRSILEAGGWSVVGGDVEHGITAGPDGARILAIITPRRTRTDAYTVVQ